MYYISIHRLNNIDEFLLYFIKCVFFFVRFEYYDFFCMDSVLMHTLTFITLVNKRSMGFVLLETGLIKTLLCSRNLSKNSSVL